MNIPRRMIAAGRSTLLCGWIACATLAGIIVAPAHAGQFHVLHAFRGGNDGGFPDSGVVDDKAGNLYGSTYYGGRADAGTVFRIALGGRETMLYVFSGARDGANPAGNLTIGKRRDLYGATFNGGANNYGTVFRLASDGTETVLHAFSNGSDGGAPLGGLVLSHGSLYGVAGAGGAYGGGVVFSLTPGGKETVLHEFSGGNDGYEPLAGVVLDSAGNLYGTTSSGGADSQGTVYRISPDGTQTVLHAFAGEPDGSSPAGALIFDSGGNLYGTTGLGGANDAGSIFKIASDGTESILYSFAGGSDGADPACTLVIDGSGNLYGTAPLSQTDGDGTIFELSGSGMLSVLHTFAGRDGANPNVGLFADTAGNLFGTAPQGGLHGYGDVFRLTE